jgi:hypothetical protein
MPAVFWDVDREDSDVSRLRKWTGTVWYVRYVDL